MKMVYFLFTDSVNHDEDYGLGVGSLGASDEPLKKRHTSLHSTPLRHLVT